MLGTPLHHAVTFMPSQIVPDHQYSDGREKAIQLVGGWIDIPILPAPTNGNRLRSRRTLFQDGGQFSFQPGMQNGIGTLLDRFGAQFSGRRPKQREQLRCFSSKILMGLACWLIFPLPGPTKLRNGLIGASFILTPHLQPQPFADHISSLNHLRFFLRVFVIAFFDSSVFFPQRLASLTPGAALLPTVASFMQRIKNGKRAHLWQAVRSFSQGTS